MNRYKSVFSLFVRCSFGKVVAVILITAALQSFLFLHHVSGLAASNQNICIESLFESSFTNGTYFGVLFLTGLTLIMLVANIIGKSSAYTLNRLGLSRKSILFCHWIYTSICIFIYWSSQIVTAFFILQNLSSSYSDLMPDDFNIFLVFWRSNVLHKILPLYDPVDLIKTLAEISLYEFLIAFCGIFSTLEKKEAK